MGYSILAERLSKEISSTDRIYQYFARNRTDFFIQDGGKQVILYEISRFN